MKRPYLTLIPSIFFNALQLILALYFYLIRTLVLVNLGITTQANTFR
jgi:hypothetical protein